MDQERRSLRLGAAIIVCAVVLRLAATGFFSPLTLALARPEVLSLVTYLETGRVVRPAEIPTATATVPTPTPAATTAAPSRAAPVFSAQDAEKVEIKDEIGADPDLAALLLSPLDLDLTGPAPRVLILHTHTTESYTEEPGREYTPSSDFHSLEEQYNMLSVGDRLTELLEERGVAVIHDRSIHDYPSYNGSYEDAREAIEGYLAQYPTIRLVLDLHRDAAEDANGDQVAHTVQGNGTQAAQLMLVMGSDAGGLNYPAWRENLALAVKLQATLESLWPGICRPLDLCAQRFNQDLSPGALLIEVGGAGNTLSQALAAMEPLAEAIDSLNG